MKRKYRRKINRKIHLSSSVHFDPQRKIKYEKKNLYAISEP
jgi:hypothetical protein